MSELSNRYWQIMKDLQTSIKDEEDKRVVMEKFQELSMMFMDIIDRLTYLTDLRIKEVEEQQKEIDDRMTKIQKAVDGIENDIYEEDEVFEFEIICPYCNHEFVTDINSEISTELECPECHNIIELDWNDEEECQTDCSCCEHDCMSVAEEEETYDIMENDKIQVEESSKQKRNAKNKKTKKPLENEQENEENKEDDDM